MKDKKIVYILGAISILFALLLFFSIYKNKISENNRINQQKELDSVYYQLDSISIELGKKILAISQLGGEIDTLIAIKEKLESEKKEFRRKAYSQINRLQSKVDGYRELLIAQDEEINKLKKINEELFKENSVQKEQINELNSEISSINKSKNELESKVDIASKLTLNSLKVFGITRSGKEILNTFRSRQINKIKIIVDIAENNIAPIEVKNILIRIIKPDNNVLYDISKGSGSFKFEKREIFYTLKKEILFNKKNQILYFDYIKNIEFKPGNYSVEIYTENYLIGKDQFIIK